MHSLDYDMVVQVLQQFHYSGEARAHIPPQTGMKDGGRIILTVENGRVLFCFILDKNGNKVPQNQQAQRLLAGLGLLEWDLIPLSSSTQPTYQPPTTQPAQARHTHPGTFPRRLEVSQAQMNSWPMVHRLVYLLCDGSRSSEHIAALLSRPHDLVEQALNDLLRLHAIE